MLKIETTKIIKIGKKDYQVTYPNVGQTIDIENSKILLSGNMYSAMSKSSHRTAIMLLNLIDGIAYFSVLAPDFKEDYNVVNFLNMDLIKQTEVTKAFVKSFWPWFDSINTELNKDDEDEENTGS